MEQAIEKHKGTQFGRPLRVAEAIGLQVIAFGQTCPGLSTAGGKDAAWSEREEDIPGDLEERGSFYLRYLSVRKYYSETAKAVYYRFGNFDSSDMGSFVWAKGPN